MKKLMLLLILPLFLLLVFTGCTSCPKKQPPPPAPAAEVVAPQPEVQEMAPPPEEPMAAIDPIYFDFDKSNIREDAKATLSKNAEWMAKNPAAKIQIEGNCDERGTSEYNVALGERRATSAKQYLMTLGVASERLITVSYGKEKPLYPGHDEAAWAKNRRDDFKIMK